MNVTAASSYLRSAEAPQRPGPATAFKQMDTQGKGYLTQDEFSSAQVNISAEGRRLAGSSDQPSAQVAFASMDTDADGKLTAAEIELSAPQQGPDSTTRAGGPPPGQGAGRAPPGGEARNNASEDNSQSYDAADSDQDGTVTLQEQQTYDAEQSRSNSGASSASLGTRAALQTYQSLQSAQ